MSYCCALPRCDSPTHPSQAALQEHIKEKHMTLVSLPCPFRVCQDLSLLQGTQRFLTHLHSFHASSIGQSFASPDQVFLPLWGIHRVIDPLEPPRLPLSVPLGEILVGPSWKKRKPAKMDVDDPPSSQHSVAHAVPLPATQPRMPTSSPGRPTPLRESFVPHQSEAHPEDEIILADLPSVRGVDLHLRRLDIMIWRRPAALDRHLHESQPMIPVPALNEPRQSILYPVFRDRQAELEEG